MALRSLRFVSLLGLLPVLAACEDGSSPGGGAGEVGTPTTTPAPAEKACEVATKGPTLHKGEITGEEVWRADASPHVIESTVNIRDGAKLTIEPCSEVQIAKSAYIQVAYPITPNTGTLIAEGTLARPIRFVGKDGARWSSVAVHAPGTARFAHVSFENGGGGDFQDNATIVAYGDGVDGADPIVFMDHVTIAKSLGVGAWFQRGATFIEGSHDLTIRESGSTAFPYPIEIEEHALDALPTGSYTKNLRDEILLDPRGGQMSGSGILADTTLHDRGVPYHVGKSKGTSLIVGGRPDAKLVTLTIEAGVVLRFESGGAFKVQHFVNQKPSTAAVRALGTAERPIVFTSVAASPQPGDWQGLWFGGVPDPSNVIDHVRIEAAGGDCGCILNTCSAIAAHEGAIIFTAQPPKAFVTNTTFANIAGHGISQGFDGAFVDFRPTNDFIGLSGCPQTRPRDSSTSCPSPRPACD